MEQFIGCDAHKNFSVFVVVNEKGRAGEAFRVAHDRLLYREFLARLPAHSEIAVEASRNYSWLVDEMERAGHRPRLCNPFEAKRRMGLTHKTDKLDAQGLAILLRNGTLPEVWIPPSELRDQRELLRLRIFLVRLRTRVKNRIHGTLSRHNVQVPGADLFGAGPRAELGARLPELPLHSRQAIEQELATLDFLEVQIADAGATAGSDYEGQRGGGSSEDTSVRRNDFEHGDDAGDRASRSLSDRGSSGQLRRPGSTRSLQRRSHANGTGLRKCEPQSQMGVRRDGELDRDQPAPISGHACRPLVPTDQACQESPEGSDGCGPPLG